MTSDTVFNNEKDKTQPTTGHFDITHSEEDDAEVQLTNEIDSSPISTKSIDTIDDQSLNKLNDDWLALDAELRLFEPKHKEYVSKLDEVESLKTKYRLEFDKYKKKLDQLKKDLKKIQKSSQKKSIYPKSIEIIIKFLPFR